MNEELQMDIAHIIGSILLAIISKIIESVTGNYTLFAIINLISLICFVVSIFFFIQHKYNVKILKLSNKKEVRN